MICSSSPSWWWYGVSCSHKQIGRVTVLELPSKKLSGSISPHIGNLSFLQRLLLSNNSLIEGIPPEIGRLNRLQHLILQDNLLGGLIPSNISGCSALTLFYVGNNELVGRIPWQLGSLQKLQDLWINSNNLTGTIIPHSLGNLSSLRVFYAAENRFSGGIRDVLGQMTSLEELIVASNNLSGEIPDSVFNLSSLTILSFGVNKLHDNLPREMGLSLPNLVHLDMAENQFSGSIPASLSNASNLVILQLQFNNFTGRMPGMESSHKLSRIYIYQNSLGGGKADDLSFFSSLPNATSLVQLFVHVNHFEGNLSEVIGSLPTSLEMLSLYRNRFSGRIPSAIQNLVNLQVLDAHKNDLSGEIPSIIGKMGNLQYIDLSSNNIAGNIPSAIGKLTRLYRLDLGDNRLQGEIPAAIGNCTSLIGLSFSQNNLSGNIPSQLMGLSSLSLHMLLSHNRLSGTIPISIGSLTNLGELDLSHNMLSGEIPASLGSCAKLEMLSLQSNLLQGTIPSSLSSLRSIKLLDISSNNLSGQFPKSFEGMKLLQLLNLSYNNIEGEVPSNGVFRNGSMISIVGNGKLCGGVIELNLPPCNFKQKKKAFSHKLIIKIVISTVSSVLLLAFVGSWLLIFWNKKRGKHETVSAGDSQLPLSYRDLYKATNGFSRENLVGVGSFGSVYKGLLDKNGIATTIAVKVFNLQRRGGSKSFMAECAALKNIRHKNLVRILTVCSGIDDQMNDFKALVYEYLANGSLEDWLHPVADGNEPLRSLNFLQRLNVVIDVATAVDYIHHQCGTPIVHCDLKPSNVLLNEDMTGHVNDFGLARFLQPTGDSSSIGQMSSTIGIKGTIGYAPPEYGMGNEVSKQGDVYSYGVLLCEVFTGKRPTDVMFKGGMNIHTFVRTALSEKLMAQVLDPVLINELPLGQATPFDAISSSNTQETKKKKGKILEEVLISILEIGVVCSSDSPNERISIGEIVTRLVSMKNLLHDKFAQRQIGGM
ncbi:unnamed protein product [Linum trigynum]|uniref:non-specific serine/threonine protein kinase n=1 Tax=Linum trigynum TaxID=586398 RepID=A0AAV2D330_9ROSI